MGAEMSGLSGLGPGDEGQAYTEGRQDWLSTFHLRLPQPDGPVKEALAGDVDAIRARLDEGLGVGELHEWAGMPRVGWRVPLLLAAAEAGHVALVDLLLERGADPNQFCTRDQFALYGVAMVANAARNNPRMSDAYLAICSKLLDAGANIDLQTGPRTRSSRHSSA